MRILSTIKCFFLQPSLGNWPLVFWATSRRRTEAALPQLEATAWLTKLAPCFVRAKVAAALKQCQVAHEVIWCCTLGSSSSGLLPLEATLKFRAHHTAYALMMINTNLHFVLWIKQIWHGVLWQVAVFMLINRCAFMHAMRDMADTGCGQARHSLQVAGIWLITNALCVIALQACWQNVCTSIIGVQFTIRLL